MPRFRFTLQGMALVEGKLVVEGVSLADAEKKARARLGNARWKAISVPAWDEVTFASTEVADAS